MADENKDVAVRNPFTPEERTEETGVQALVESDRAVAEVKAAVAMAMANPRDPVKATDRILRECQRPTLAEQAVYAYPRGGTQVSGPSIRLAEAIGRAWGNLDFGIKEMSRQGRQSEVMAYAWDLETNTRSTKTFVVRHERDTKQGKRALTEERDIYEMVANMGARRVRNCILSLIPGDVISAAVEQCDATIQKSGGAPEEQIKNMLKAFGKLGVTQAQIEKRLQHHLTPEATVWAEISSLKKIYNSVNDGMSTVAAWFEIEKADTKATAKEKVSARAKKTKADEKADENTDTSEDGPELDIY